MYVIMSQILASSEFSISRRSYIQISIFLSSILTTYETIVSVISNEVLEKRRRAIKTASVHKLAGF